MTDELSPEPFSLDDEQIETARPRVRALNLQRLEMIWRQVEEHLDPEAGGSDPRWAEIGLRVLRDEGRLYRFDRAPAVKEDDEDVYIQGVDRKAAVLAQLEALADSLRGNESQDPSQTEQAHDAL